MRLVVAVLVGVLLATELPAQHRMEPSALGDPLRPRVELPTEGEAAEPSLEFRREVDESRTSPLDAPAMVLDDAFWRQVLAGVVITVVSTLILPVIL